MTIPTGLTVHANLEQGTPEWHEVRRGIVTASVVGQLLTPALKVANNDTSRGLTALLVAERITGYTEPTRLTDDMWRGIEDEPRARDLYSEHYAPVTEVGFMVREMPLESLGRGTGHFRLGYSPDGVVGDDGLIEVKSRRQKTHLSTILRDEVPAANMAQLQAGLYVSGRDWIDYVSYCGGLPMYVKRVHPDQDWFNAINEATDQFERNATDWADDYLERIEGLIPTERPNYEAELKL